MHKLIATAALVVLSSSSSAARGQTSHTHTRAPAPRIVGRKLADVPFGIHEKASFKVTFGGIGVGNGTTEIEGIDTIRGVPSYHLVLKIKGGIPFAHVDDKQESWLDVTNLSSLRFHQDLHEVKYERDLTFDMYASDNVWRSVNHLRKATDPKHEESGPLGSMQPLDDISFMYWARTMQLEVGKTYTIPRYFKQDGNPVMVKVLRRQTVKVPAGTFNTIVLQPVIRTKGLFAEGGEAELYFSDDAKRMLVMLNTKLSIGSLKLQLEKYEAGSPLTSSSF